MNARRIRLTVGSTHTLLKPTTVYVVTELRRVPNLRGTTSTVPVWLGACRDCGAEFEQPRPKPTTRRCGSCRGIPKGEDISPDVSVVAVNQAARTERIEREAREVTHTAVALYNVRAPQFPQPQATKPVFTDR